MGQIKCYQHQFDSLRFYVNDTDDVKPRVILTLIFIANTMLSADCPTVAGMTITPSTGPFEAGDELTCGSDGYSPTYTWSGTTGVGDDSVSSSPNPFTLPEGPFSLTCTADVSELGCTATTTIVETAYSKYSKHHNTLLTMPMLMTVHVV